MHLPLQFSLSDFLVQLQQVAALLHLLVLGQNEVGIQAPELPLLLQVVLVSFHPLLIGLSLLEGFLSFLVDIRLRLAAGPALG
mmetsp:Transcript_39369/g.60191  ORF Transcript_39369/g.60191 Transcript_39369/m.60191 type:complete len:83 (+) Transcript_39369:6105-6353(+)